MRSFPSKDPTESLILGFDFTKDLPAGITLTGVPTFTIAIAPGGIDPNVSAMLIGSPQLVGNIAVQMCVAGVAYQSYTVQAICHASDGEIFAQGATLPMIPAYAQ